MAYKRTAFTLIIITIVTAICVSVLIWNNLKGGSSLILMVPKDATSLYHLKTRDLRAKLTDNIPRKNYFDSLSITIKKSPLFAKYSDPDEPGIDKFSDLIFFTTPKGKFIVLQINAPAKFETFLRTQSIETMSKPSKRDRYTYHSITGKNIYLAYHGKGLMLYQPDSAYNNIPDIEATFNNLFDPKLENILKNEAVKKMVNEKSDVIYWQQNHPMSFLATVNTNNTVTFVYQGLKDDKQPPSPLKFFQSAGLTYKADYIDQILKPNNQISAAEYLNQTFRLAYFHLKQI